MNRAPGDESAAPSKRASMAAAAVLVVYVAVYVTWTWLHFGGDPTVVSDIAPLPVGYAAAGLTWWASRDRRVSPRRRRAWRWIAVGCLCWAFADTLWLYLELVANTTPFPSVADVFYLAFYPLVLVGLVLLSSREHERRERTALVLDLAAVMLASLMLLWYLVAAPTVRAADSSLLAEVLSLAYPVGDVMLLLGVARLLMRRRTGSEDRLTIGFLVGGILVLAVADIVYARLDLAGEYTPGTLPDALWVVALLGIALAAVAQLARPAGWGDGNESPQRMGVSKLPYAAVVVGLALVLYETTRDLHGPLIVLVLGALSLTIIVVVRQVTVLRENERLVGELDRLANTDPLTGLANRRRFFEMAPRIVTRALLSDERVSAVMFDIDRFKAINDRWGHRVGDEVIKAVTQRCQTALRPTDLFARIGGDEFVVVLVGDPESARAGVATRLCQHVSREPVETSAGPIEVTISVGIATSTTDDALDRLLQDADSALFDSKRAGRNTVSAWAGLDALDGVAEGVSGARS